MRPLVMHCISTLFPYGGSSRKLLAWVRHSSLAHVFVFYEDDHGSSEESARKLRSGFVAKGARIVRVGRRTVPGQIAAIGAMAKRADGPVALVGHYFRGSALACLSGALCGAPAVLALHGPACLMSPGRKAVHRLFSLQAAIVIYNSEYTARTFASARDPGAWADAVMRIASDPDGVWERCVAAREWALGRFSGVEYARRMDAAVLCAATSPLQTTAGSRV